MAFCEGCHLSLFILTANSGVDNTKQDCNIFLYQCLQLYLKAQQARQTGLTSSYLAVVAGSEFLKPIVAGRAVEQFGFCDWHKLSPWQQLPPSTQPSLGVPFSSSTHKCDELSLSGFHGSSSVDTLLETVRSCSESWRADRSPSHHGGECSNKELEEVAGHIHSLLDKLPNASYSVMDVYWLIPDPHSITSPSTAVGLYGALLRLQQWHNAHIEMVIPSSSPVVQSSPWPFLEWRQALERLSLCSVREWRPASSVIWRGAIHVTENKTPKQASHRTLIFPGFSLSLDLSVDEPIQGLPSLGGSVAPGEALEGVGLKMDSTFHPTHLELLQIVDMATVPLFWVSPLHCQLSLTDTDSNVSHGLFQYLLSNTSGRSVGIIMCLCSQSQENCRFVPTTLTTSDTVTNGGTAQTSSCSAQTGVTRSQTPTRNRTTSEWVEFIQGLEQESILGELEEKPPTPLAAYGTGPRLLITPVSSNQSDRREWSCEAWLLWKPEVVNSIVFTKMMSQQMKAANDEDQDTILSSLTSHCLANNQLLEVFRERLRQNVMPSELASPPSEWPEVKALKTYEWIQRKMIRRIATPDLMFGHMVAPPPRNVTSQIDSLQISDVLDCFTDHGSPVTSELSPIAMSGPSKLTKVHVPDSKVSYKTIIASTPTSKKHYHGVSYCLTDEDTSIDAKLTKIQQRYLFSERASHCSTVVTPKAERAKQQARRMKIEAVSLNTQQDKEKESTPNDTELNPNSQIGSTVSQSGSSTLQAGSCIKITPKKKLSSQTKRTFSTGRPLDIMKSPLVKITRLHSKRTADPAKTSPGQSTEKGRKVQSKKTMSVPLSPLATRNHNSEKDGHHMGVPLSPTDETKPLTKNSNTLTKNSNTLQRTNNDDNTLPSSVRGGDQEQKEEVVTETDETVEQNEADSPPATVSSHRLLRRSPRTTKWRSKMEETTSSCAELASEGRRSSRKKRKKIESLKVQLGVQVVSALKSKEMPRSHPLFRKCFTRLFNISKSFLQDLDIKAAALKQEIKKVVELNASQVVTFELKRHEETS